MEVPDGGWEEDHDGDPRGEMEETLAGDCLLEAVQGQAPHQHEEAGDGVEDEELGAGLTLPVVDREGEPGEGDHRQAGHDHKPRYLDRERCSGVIGGRINRGRHTSRGQLLVWAR